MNWITHKFNDYYSRRRKRLALLLLPLACFAQSGPTFTVTPVLGMGASQSFTFGFYDPAKAFDIAQVHMFFNSSLTGVNSCYLLYVVASNALYLHTDDGNNFTEPVTPGGTGTLSNSQCSVAASGTAVLVSGVGVIVTAGINFTSGFGGVKNIYMTTYNDAETSSDWVSTGTWQVAGGNYKLEREYEKTLGAVDGTNTMFTLSAVPAFPPDVYLNGVKMRADVDYTFSVQVITFASAARLTPGAYIEADYWH